MSAATAPANFGPQRVLFSQAIELKKVSLRLPRIWIGLSLGCICLVAEIASFTGIGSDGLLAADAVAGWLGLGYWLFCVHRMHRILAEATNGSYPIGPRRALWFHFIPLFSLYWYFRWPYRMAKFVDALQPSSHMARIWPGLFLMIGMLFGFPSIRLFLLFGVGVYLTRKLRKLLTFSDAEHFAWKEQLDLAISAGLGAGFALVLGQATSQAIADFPGITSRSLLVEGLCLALVSIGIARFVEPVLDALRAGIGMPVHHSVVEAKKTWLFRAVIALFLLLGSVSHELLHTYIHEHPSEAARALAAMLLVSGSITYAWVAGAQRQNAHAGRLGFIGGGGMAFLLILVLWLGPVSASAQADFSQGVAERASGPLVPLLMASRISSVSIAVPLLLWGLFGLAGGTSIDRRWKIRGAPQVAIVMSVLTTAFLALLALFIASRTGVIHYDEVVGTEVTVGVSSIVGWCAGLLISPKSASLLCRKHVTISG